MTVYLARKGYHYSPATIHKYMNAELGLRSIVRPQKTDYEQGKPHKVFENKLQQNFMSDKINQKWCTDFTYLFLKNHDVRYNCSIIDLHDRSVIASITDRHITSDLAIRTLQKALDSQPAIKGELILHSDQGSQYTSKAFTDFCKSVNVTQSMSKAGYPYDNAPMERCESCWHGSHGDCQRHSHCETFFSFLLHSVPPCFAPNLPCEKNIFPQYTYHFYYILSPLFSRVVSKTTHFLLFKSIKNLDF